VALRSPLEDHWWRVLLKAQQPRRIPAAPVDTGLVEGREHKCGGVGSCFELLGPQLLQERTEHPSLKSCVWIPGEGAESLQVDCRIRRVAVASVHTQASLQVRLHSTVKETWPLPQLALQSVSAGGAAHTGGAAGRATKLVEQQIARGPLILLKQLLQGCRLREERLRNGILPPSWIRAFSLGLLFFSFGCIDQRGEPRGA
jgi:hypothetical protein